MKTIKVLSLFLIFSVFHSCCSLFSDCDDIEDPVFSQYEPIHMDRNSFENSILLKNPISIINSGKIYIHGDLLFINDINKGFHIYDNSDPTAPIAIRFLEVPGSTDLAIRESIIYINQATDLIAIQYNKQNHDFFLTKRITNTFPELLSPDGYYATNIPNTNVVVDWKLIN
ncbi:hypothetical protein [Aquimarina sp. 2201CG5-10]|uniref:hypothetical protein n=1 Tax=Aquimarina callyspongiae TaxID=3098150 RepID=UPI002AB43F4D|nr:hypothetical protein [Aquimarina sp. 2201CG5-10]MDY8137366.1 hypothetical protein [Aquimarina sp. 2201CG5-10]